LEEGKARILLDPGVYSEGFEDLTDLDAVLITHQHHDHTAPENIKSLQEKNPDLAVYADERAAKVLDAAGVGARVAHEGDEFEVEGVSVAVRGRDHAVIHPDIPRITNVGYLVAGRFFYPGDSFTEPGGVVDVLAVPAGAPWLKISEAIDYMLAVKPKVAIPVHDAVLAMPQMNAGLLKRFAGPAAIELRVVENGSSTEV
jgi:L-ascorbate metabolism protein UlaG (beta-lactamase superfamily)